MYIFYFLATFLLLNRLHKTIKITPLREKWSMPLIYAQWAVWVLFAVIVYYFEDEVIILAGAGLLLGTISFLLKEDDFKNFRSFLHAHYPLVAVGIIVGITTIFYPDFVEAHDSYFDLPVIAAFLWIFARWATAKKQQQEFVVMSMKNTELDRLVAERTIELTEQKNELQKTLDQLQTTQEQLIQSEKLASLGELTAGIAHEIQNPLNFVNNFSEVSMEMIDEMEEELAKGDKEEAMAIAADIKTNLEKIRHHGQRADGIVKGMLQHSRASSNTKEPVDINKLADEYLRLSYHGLRAKDKSFNSELETHFGTNIPMINIVPQDIGRVLLNLFNNAFYAVQQRQKIAGGDYKPVVKITTGVNGKFLIINVEDNGIGIPDEVIDKILQPFFTTKPTGEGTGLGLSLSYDIIAKGHGGKIDIQSKENDHTVFTISLPLS